MLNAFTDWLREKYHYSRYRIFRQMLQAEGKALLDVGCGTPCDSMKPGAFLRYIGYGTGVDIVEYDLEFPFKKGSITDLPFEDHAFDVVVAGEILEHVIEVEAALNEVQRVLKPGGAFLVSTPTQNLCFRTIWFFWVRTVGRMWKDTHLTSITSVEWLRILSKRFAVEKTVHHLGMVVMLKMRQSKS